MACESFILIPVKIDVSLWSAYVLHFIRYAGIGPCFTVACVEKEFDSCIGYTYIRLIDPTLWDHNETVSRGYEPGNAVRDVTDRSPEQYVLSY